MEATITRDVSEIEKAISMPVESWAGNCHEVAGKIFRAKLAPGKVRYGHYWGPVAEGGLFNPQIPLQRHGWIELPDGQVYDATRWVFENVPPYIYIGPADDYDAGGNRMRDAMGRPAPRFDAKHRIVLLIFDQKYALAVSTFLHRHMPDNPGIIKGSNMAELTIEQVFWLANLSLHMLGGIAHTIFDAIIGSGHAEAIPFDNRVIIYGTDDGTLIGEDDGYQDFPL